MGKSSVVEDEMSYWRFSLSDLIDEAADNTERAKREAQEVADWLKGK